MKWVKCQDIAKQIRGVSYSKKDVRDKPFEDCIPILRAGNVDDKSGTIDFNQVYYLPKTTISDTQIMQKGDILIAASSGSIEVIGKSALFDHADKTTFGAFCKVIRPNTDKVIYKYLFYFFRSSTYRRKIKELAQGANINNIRNDDLDLLQIPLPSLSEQKAIVAKLDRAQRLIDIDREMLQRYDDLIQSVFLEMFGDPVRNEVDNKAIFELHDVVKIRGGGTPSKKNKKFWNGDIPWVSPKDMKSSFITDTIDHVTATAVKDSSTSLIKPGAVLAVVRSGILKKKWPLAVNIVPVTLNQDMKAMQCSNELNEVYMLYYLRSYSRIVLKSVRGTTADNLSSEVLKNIPVLVPSINEQNRFAKIVELIMSEKENIDLDNSRRLFSSLIQQAFS